jgi:hypothetical protein
MKKVTILYWIFTGIFSALMVLSAIPDVSLAPEALAIFARLGYPPYLLPFLGTAKILGVAVVLVPWFRRLKEWAYAGIAIDLVGAFYSHLSVGDPPSVWKFPVIGLVLLTGSYFFYQRKLAAIKSTSSVQKDSIREGRNEPELPLSV